MKKSIMRLTINIPDPPKNQCLIDISLHFLDGQIVEYTAPSGWVVKEQKQTRPEKLLSCTCGSNMRHLWMNTTPGEPDWFYICGGCGRKVYGKNKTDLKRKWNETIRKEENND
jgi:hypothetical protein